MLVEACKPIEIVAAELKRSAKAVNSRAYVLRISLKRVNLKPKAKGEMRPLVASPVWTREEDELLLALVFGEAVAP